MKQKTIGINPLEEYLSNGKKKKSSHVDEAGEQPAEAQPQPTELPTGQLTFAPQISGATEDSLAEGPRKQRITLHISSHIIDRVKNAVYWEPGLTIAGFAEKALSKALDEIEAERGSPFPSRRTHKLRGGRPLI